MLIRHELILNQNLKAEYVPFLILAMLCHCMYCIFLRKSLEKKPKFHSEGISRLHGI